MRADMPRLVVKRPRRDGVDRSLPFFGRMDLNFTVCTPGRAWDDSIREVSEATEDTVERSHAADDFATIRARMEELRRGQPKLTPSGTRPVRRALLVDRPDTPPKIRQFLLKHGREAGKF
jgi:hypothetical protein